MFGSETKRVDMICILVLFGYFSSTAFSTSALKKLPVPSPGPVNFAFDLRGEGPYTGVADGRILKYDAKKNSFVDFAYTSPNRSRAVCDGIDSTEMATVCGRPVGLAFNHATGDLYITDAGYGLLVVGRKGGLATQLANSAEDIPFRSPDAVEVDQATGAVYLTDPSSVFRLSEFEQLLQSNDSTGRLFKYDPKTKKLTVLLRDLGAPSGLAISKDGSFLVFTEFIRSRVQKYWLKGPKAKTVETFVNLIGNPDKISATKSGDFWVGVNLQKKNIDQQSVNNLELHGVKIDGFGHILKTVTFSPKFRASLITEVYENQRTLYVGSTNARYIGVYRQRHKKP